MSPGPDGGGAGGRYSVAEQGARWFRTCYGHRPQGVWLAPGRVNIIGEHTDYNDGFVLPFALGQGIVAAASPRRDDVLALRTRRDPAAHVEIPLARLRPGPDGKPAVADEIRDQLPSWARYPAGVAWALLAAGHPVPGASLAVDSCLADGAGLSSSAALECSVALALTELVTPDSLDVWATGGQDPAGSRPDVPRPELAAIARRAENEFAGVPSGIMDQSASLLCRAEHALLLDCQSLESSQVPFKPDRAGVRVLVIDTRAKHELTDGEYGSRQAECAEAARRLGVPSLRAVHDVSGLHGLDDPVLHRRARHVVTDNLRVRQVTGLLRASGGGDFHALSEVGTLLTQSHASLRDDFEVSWPEADVAVDVAVEAGALGARMTGGGFGGSALALVPEADLDQVQARVRSACTDRGWTEPEFLSAFPSGAAQRMI
ncbi:MAG TPA: galactokinase [Streptosporangiaceae bacterium]|nr:galactokinase [Streptosporangiaceae bacterium]